MNEQLVLQAVKTFIAERIEKDKKNYKGEVTEGYLQSLKEKHSIHTWLSKVADAADQVSLNVTHVSKLTHSSSKASNVTDNIKQEQFLHLITTQTVKSNERDLAYSNALHSPIAEFLSYEVKGSNQVLGELLSVSPDNYRLLSQNEVEIALWYKKIVEAFQPTQLQSHVLAKQVYIPIGERINGEYRYHLVSPVKSSALAHKIFLKVKESRDSKEPVNVARKNKAWSELTYNYFANVARISVTKSNHQNASKLNGARSGGMYLFLSEPPTWKRDISSQTTQLVDSVDKLLSVCFTKEVQILLKELGRYLSVIERKKIALNHQQRQIFREKIQDILDELMNTILLLQIDLQAVKTAPENMPKYLQILLLPHLRQENTVSFTQLDQYTNELVMYIVKWISLRVGNKERLARYENLWAKIIKPHIRNFYAAMVVRDE